MVDNSSMTANMTPAEIMDNAVIEAFGFSRNTLLWMYGAIAVLGLLGVVGNVVSMVIWTRPQVRSSSSVLLTALAGCDLLILVTINTIIDVSVLSVNFLDSPAIVYMDNFIVPYVSLWGLSVYRVAQTASMYLTLAITLERYIVVCRPFKARVVCTNSRACKCVVAIITVSILYNLVEFLRQEVVAVRDNKGDIRYYDTKGTELAQSPVYQTIYELYKTWLYVILMYLLPLICIAVLNTIIYLEMRRVKKVRQVMTISQRKDNRLTMMLVYVVAEFFVCSSVVIMSAIIAVFAPSLEQLGFNLDILHPLHTFFETFNSSSNVLMYFVFGSGFREVLLRNVSCCRRLCRLRLRKRTEDRELGVRTPEIAKCQPPAGNQTTDLEMCE